MSSAERDSILSNLEIVEGERRRRASNAALDQKVLALKAFQQRRFTHTYADLLASDRYRAACRFFLEQLYGPEDFARRDAQFAKMVSGLGTFFPQEVVHTVGRVAELHALSEVLDSEMARLLPAPQVAPLDYVRAWQRVGRAPDRQRQIVLSLGVAETLDALTRNPLLRKGLRLMRTPARVAGVYDLHRFVEIGFDAFAAMQGAQEFIATVRSREEAFAAAIFAADPADAAASTASVLAALA